MKFYHKIFAIIFIVALLGFAIINFALNFHSMKIAYSEAEISLEKDNVKSYTTEIDSLVSNYLLFDHAWNEIYAMTYNALGKNEENSFKILYEIESGELKPEYANYKLFSDIK